MMVIPMEWQQIAVVKSFITLAPGGGAETRISGDSYKRRFVYLLILEEIRIQ